MIPFRATRRALAGRVAAVDGGLRAQTRAFDHARVLVRVYYAGLLVFAVSAWPPGPLVSGALDPLWPVSWIGSLDSPESAAVAITAVFWSGVLAAAIWPGSRSARVVAFLGLFLFDALRNSFGKVGHGVHLLDLVTFVMIFLPRGAFAAGEVRRVVRQSALQVVWACQATVLLTYSMSGLGKVAGAGIQWLAGERHALSPDALAAHVAARLLETGSESAPGAFIIEHAEFGAPLMLATLYVEVFAFFAVFRPSLQRPWAAALICFHIGTLLTMTIHFPWNIFLLALLFFASPFPGASASLRDSVRDLPVFGDLLRWLRRA